MHIYICHNYLIGMFEAGGRRGRGTKPTAVFGLKNFSFSCHTALPFLWLFYLHGEQQRQPALKLAVCRATINSSSSNITTNRSNIPSNNNNNKIKFNESQMRNKQKGRASCCVVLCGIWLPFFMAIFNVIFSVEWGIQGVLLL